MSLENIAIAIGFSASPFVKSSGAYLVHAVMHFCDEFFNLFEYFPSVDSSFKIYGDFKLVTLKQNSSFWVQNYNVKNSTNFSS